MNLRDALDRNRRDARDAREYRLWQAGQLLRQAGFVEQNDGMWQPGWIELDE